MDVAGRAVSREGKEFTLTAREFDLLHYLLRNQGRVVSPEMLARDVWQENARYTPLAKDSCIPSEALGSSCAKRARDVVRSEACTNTADPLACRRNRRFRIGRTSQACVSMPPRRAPNAICGFRRYGLPAQQVLHLSARINSRLATPRRA